MSQPFYQRGIEFAKQAVAADEREEYEEALGLYIHSLEFLLTGLKYEKMAKIAQYIKARVLDYMHRAEVLRPVVQAAQEKKQRAAAGKARGRVAAGGEVSQESSFDAERQRLRASLDDTIVKEKPTVRLDDVVGMQSAKAALHEAVVLPQVHPQLFQGKRKPWKGVLLYGPPGTGKSFLAKAMASEVSATFFSVSSSDLVSKFQGESERLIRELFRMAQERKPAVIFIDEIDALCRSRSVDESDAERRIKTEFLTNMQGMQDLDGVVVIAATNRPWDLDPAVRRRFEKRIYIPLPEAPERETMLLKNLGEEAGALPRPALHDIAVATERYSGADIAVMCRDALMQPVRRAVQSTHFREEPDGSVQPCEPAAPGAVHMSIMDIADPTRLRVGPITVDDLWRSLSTTRPSVTDRDLQQFEEWTAKYGMRDHMHAEVEEEADGTDSTLAAAATASAATAAVAGATGSGAAGTTDAQVAADREQSKRWSDAALDAMLPSVPSGFPDEAIASAGGAQPAEKNSRPAAAAGSRKPPRPVLG